MGINALEGMASILGELLTLKTQVITRQSSLPDFRLPGAPATRVRSKFNMNVLRAGENPDMVPDTCTLIISRRTIPEERSEDVIEEIARVVDRGSRQTESQIAEVSAVEHYPAARFDLSTTHRPRLRRVFQKIQDYGPDDWIEVGRGASDLTFAVQELGCEVVHLGTSRIGESTGDAAEDCVRLSDLHAHTRELVHYLTD
jgi:acetylornithine deacetylase/succinyl-diaminopimelate desuccinylase-like protein